MKLPLSNQNIKDLLPSHIFNYAHLPQNVKIKKNKTELLFFNYRRFDLIAKYIYVNYKLKEYKTNWATLLYSELIKYFNNYKEYDNLEKNSSEKFCEHFDFLINQFAKNKKNELDIVIPIDEDQCTLDGSHRLTLCYFFDIKISTVLLHKNTVYNSHIFNYNFFVNKGLNRKYADYIALQYAKLNPKTFIVTIFPSAYGFDSEIEFIIKKHANIYYYKEFNLTENGQKNFIQCIYSNESWLGTYQNNFEGAEYKRKECFNRAGNIKCYLIECSIFNKLAVIKNEIRAIFKIGNHSVHINDTHNQTIKIAQLIYNKNSLNFIDLKINNFFEKFSRIFTKYQDILLSSKEVDDYCISGSAILSVFGIRDCYDIDYITTNKSIQIFSDSLISCHNEEYRKVDLQITIDDIVCNPEYHFYYEGVKFGSIELLRIFKEKRNEVKDVNDCNLIDNIGKANVNNAVLKPQINFSNFSNFSTLFTDNIFEWRKLAKNIWISKIASIYDLHPKTHKEMPNYFVDRYAFRLFLHHKKNGNINLLIPEYDIEKECENWYSTIEKSISDLPEFKIKMPSLNDKIRHYDFLQFLLSQWINYIKLIGIKVNDKFCRNPAGRYWFEYFQNSVWFPKQPAMTGPTFFRKLSRYQQDKLIQLYSQDGILSFFIFLQQAHEESHFIQSGCPMLCEYFHSILWCKFLISNDLWSFQFNNETQTCCNIEYPFISGINLSDNFLKLFFEDTYQGTLSYFVTSIPYDIFCLLTWLFDNKQINYAKYLYYIQDCFKNFQNTMYFENLYCHLLDTYNVSNS